MKRERVLIQVGDHYENMERTLSLALELKKRGYIPIVLIYSNKVASKLFFNYGVDVIYLNNFLKNINFYKFCTIKKYNFDFKYKNIKLEKFYLMDILKTPWLFKQDKINYRVCKFKQYIDGLEKILVKNRIDTIFIWNGYTGNVANGLRLLTDKLHLESFFLERGILKQSVFIDKIGVNGFSSLAKKTNIPNVNNNFPIELRQNNYLEWKALLKKKIIFIPLQVENDTNIHLFSNEIKKMTELVKLVLNNIDDEYFVVVRPHPEEEKTKKLNFEKQSNLLVTQDGSLHNWLNVSDIVVTINSTVGLEAILMGKKVITLGESIYSNKGLSLKSSIEKFKNNLNMLKLFKLDENKVKNFYNYLITYHTAVHSNFPKILDIYFKDLVTDKKKIAISANPVSEKYQKYKGHFFETIVVYVDLETKYVNLTYRNNKVLVDKKYLRKGIDNVLRNLNITYENIVFNQYNVHFNNDNLNILISDKDKYDDKYHISLNQYFLKRD